jgi:lysophospholipase L1-like esterase
MTDIEIEQLASWLTFNHDRPLSEILDAIMRTWPDATAEEIKRAIQRMNEIAREKLNRQSEPIKRRSSFRLVVTESHGESV